RRLQSLPCERALALDGPVGGRERDALPGAVLAAPERARRGGGPREDPGPAPPPPPVAPAAVAPQRGQPLLSRRALESRDERPLRGDDFGDEPPVSAAQPARRPAGALDGGGLGAARRRLPRDRARRHRADSAVHVHRPRDRKSVV